MAFVDETKGLANSSDYESFSECATPPPEARSTDATSLSLTPTAQGQVDWQLEHEPTPPHISMTIHERREPSQSPNAIHRPPNPVSYRLWEERTVSNPSEVSLNPIPLLSSNPLTIQGILNKSVTDSPHLQVDPLYSKDENSPSIPPIHSDRPVWPLADPAEALLLRHFVQNLAIWVRLGQVLFVVKFN